MTHFDQQSLLAFVCDMRTLTHVSRIRQAVAGQVCQQRASIDHIQDGAKIGRELAHVLVVHCVVALAVH